MIRNIRRCFSTAVAGGMKQFNPNHIPQNLEVDREFKDTVLPNGIRVCSESWPSSLSHVTIFIKCGSRNETEQTSGAAHFLEHLHFKGTGKRVRQSIELDVENMGGQLNAYTARENTSYTMNVFNQNVGEALEIMGDMLTNSLYSKSAVENERDTIYRELIETRKMQFETTIEVSHRGAYKDHQMSLPILGKITNMYSINRDTIVEYHKQNYFGKNLIIVGGGGLNHEELCGHVDKHFRHMKPDPEVKPNPPGGKPDFKHEVFLMESELTENLNVGLFYEAPSWTHPHYYDFLLFQRLMADRPESSMEAEIFYNSTLNTFQKQQLSCQNIFNQKSVYTPYADTGLFGNYFDASPLQGIQESIKLTQSILQQYAENISEEELQRSKRRLFIELCQHETGNDITQAIANQVLYFDRRVYRQEIAKNIAAKTSQELSNTVKKWLIDKPYSLTLWGNIKPVVDQYGQEQVGTH